MNKSNYNLNETLNENINENILNDDIKESQNDNLNNSNNSNDTPNDNLNEFKLNAIKLSNNLSKRKQVNETSYEYYFMLSLLHLLNYDFDLKFKRKISIKSIQFLPLIEIIGEDVVYNDTYFNNLKNEQKKRIRLYFKNFNNKNITKTYLNQLTNSNLESIIYNLVRSILEDKLKSLGIPFIFVNKFTKKTDLLITKNRFSAIFINNKVIGREKINLIANSLYNYIILNCEKNIFILNHNDILFNSKLKDIELDSIFNNYWLNNLKNIKL